MTFVSAETCCTRTGWQLEVTLRGEGGRATPTPSGAGRPPAAGPGLTLAVGLLPVGGDGRRRVLLRVLMLFPRSVVLLLHIEALVALHLPHLQADTPGRPRSGARARPRPRPRLPPAAPSPRAGPAVPGFTAPGPERPPKRPRAAAGRGGPHRPLRAPVEP